jgi:hypothetical protein
LKLLSHMLPCVGQLERWKEEVDAAFAQALKVSVDKCNI